MNRDPPASGRIVLAGELMLDVLLSPAPHVRAGGGPATTARALSAAGREVTVLGKLGPDQNGRWIAAELAGAGVELPVAPARSRATGYVVMRRECDPAASPLLGEAAPGTIDRVVYVERGANFLLAPADVEGRLAGRSWLHLSGYCLVDSDPAEAAFLLAGEARRAGIPISLDPGVPWAFRGAGSEELLRLFRLGLPGGPDFFLPSGDMAAHLAGETAGPQATGRAARDLAGRFPRVVVKDGPAGAWVGGERAPLGGGQAAAGADVSGAGDVWNAAFIAATLDGLFPLEAAARANTQASRYVAGCLARTDAASAGAASAGAASAGAALAGAAWLKVDSGEAPLLVSACLAGVASAYDGQARPAPARGPWAVPPTRRLCLPVCPEQLGGLPTPREPAEIQGQGGGEGVMDGRGRVVDRAGRDVTAAFRQGAERVVGLARVVGASLAVLKEGSPSCGAGRIHDGRFRGRQGPGRGVTAAALRQAGVRVTSEEDWT